MRNSFFAVPYLGFHDKPLSEGESVCNVDPRMKRGAFHKSREFEEGTTEGSSGGVSLGNAAPLIKGDVKRRGSRRCWTPSKAPASPSPSVSVSAAKNWYLASFSRASARRGPRADEDDGGGACGVDVDIDDDDDDDDDDDGSIDTLPVMTSMRSKNDVEARRFAANGAADNSAEEVVDAIC